MPLVDEVSPALRIPQRGTLMMAATFETRTSRQRSIQLSRFCRPFSTHVRKVTCQSFPRCSVIAQTQAVVSDALISVMNHANANANTPLPRQNRATLSSLWLVGWVLIRRHDDDGRRNALSNDTENKPSIKANPPPIPQSV